MSTETFYVIRLVNMYTDAVIVTSRREDAETTQEIIQAFRRCTNLVITTHSGEKNYFNGNNLGNLVLRVYEVDDECS